MSVIHPSITLMQRIYQHTTNLREGFTKKYQIHQLVYFEMHQDINEAILREKKINAGSERKNSSRSVHAERRRNRTAAAINSLKSG